MGDGKPKVGDRVRVTVEGEVNYTEAVGFTVFDHPQPPNGNGMFLRYDDAIIKNVEIIERRRAVGDLVNRNEIATTWEPRSGTVIENVPGRRRFMKMISTAHWVSSAGVVAHASVMPAGDYLIVYLAEGS